MRCQNERRYVRCESGSLQWQRFPTLHNEKGTKTKRKKKESNKNVIKFRGIKTEQKEEKAKQKNLIA